MKISTWHQRFANRLGNQRALEHPEEFLGPNWKDAINFWIFLDTLTEDQWRIIRERCRALDEAFRIAYCIATRNASREAINIDIVDSVWYGSKYYSSFYATNELIGSHILTAQGKSLVFLPLFLNV